MPGKWKPDDLRQDTRSLQDRNAKAAAHQHTAFHTAEPVRTVPEKHAVTGKSPGEPQVKEPEVW